MDVPTEVTSLPLLGVMYVTAKYDSEFPKHWKQRVQFIGHALQNSTLNGNHILYCDQEEDGDIWCTVHYESLSKWTSWLFTGVVETEAGLCKLSFVLKKD